MLLGRDPLVVVLLDDVPLAVEGSAVAASAVVALLVDASAVALLAVLVNLRRGVLGFVSAGGATTGASATGSASSVGATSTAAIFLRPRRAFGLCAGETPLGDTVTASTVGNSMATSAASVAGGAAYAISSTG